MLSAVNENNKLVLATNATKKDGIFFCKGCKNQVLLKKGNVMAHHFSHTKKSDCDWGLGGEGEEHYKLKLYLYNWLLEKKEYRQILDVELEKNIDGLRADIWFKDKYNTEVAIEIQLSHRTKEYIKSKIQRYTNQNVFTMYITDMWNRTIKAGCNRVRLSDWQIYLAGITRNRLYTFTHGNNDSFKIKETKLSPSFVGDTIFYTNNFKEIDILRDMHIVKKNNFLLYQKNIYKDFKKSYPDKLGWSYLTTLDEYTFNAGDYGLNNKFTYFDNTAYKLKHIGLIVNDGARYNYTFDDCYNLIKSQWAEGSRGTPFYFNHKTYTETSHLLIFDDLFHLLEYLSDDEYLPLQSMKFCLCLDRNTAQQVDFTDKNIVTVFQLTGKLNVKDFNVAEDNKIIIPIKK